MATLELDLTQQLKKKTFDMKDYDTLKLSLENTTEGDFLDSIKKVTYSKTTMKVTANGTTFTFKNVSSDMVLEVFDKNTSSDVYNTTFDDFNTLFNKTLIIPDSSRGKTTYNCKNIENICVPATASNFASYFVGVRANGNTIAITINMLVGNDTKPITLTLKNCDNVKNVWCKKNEESSLTISGFDRTTSFYTNVMNSATNITDVDKKGSSTVTGSIWDDTINLVNSSYEPTSKRAINNNTGVTIKSGNGGDKITGTKYNDTITGGLGTNTVYLEASDDGFGSDIINLTKGETLNIVLDDDVTISGYAQGSDKKTKNDLVVTTNKGIITLKNYFAKDTGAVVNINGVDLTKTVKLAEVNASNYFDIEGAAVRKYTGSALADKVVATNVTQLKDRKGNLLDTGVTLNTGLGDDVIYGSKYNDTITGGKGDNTIYHYAGEGDDTIVLTKGENLTIHLADIDKSNLTYSSDKKGNLVISYTQDDKSGSVILKNFYKKDTTGADTYVKLITQSETINNLREDIFLNEIVTNKNYTGSWLSEEITGQLEEPTNKKKNTGLTLNGGAGDDTITGTDYADTLTGGDGIDTIYGGKGDDTIKGGNGNDEIIGGEGDDFIYGEGGINKIYFKEGDGKDTVYSGKGEDTLIFQDINLENVSVSNNKKDMVISYGDDDSVIVKNYYTVDKKGHITGKNANNSVKHIDFGDGEDYNFIFNNEVNANIEGSSGADLIRATGGNNTITLHGGNDIVRLGAGDSTVKIDMSVFDSTVQDEGEEWEWTKYSENCTKTIYLNSDTSSTLTIDIDKEIFDGKALGVFCRGTGQDNDLYISLDGGMGYCIRVKDYFDENGDPKTDRVKLNVWEYPEQFSTELVPKQYTVPEWTDGSIWERAFDVQPFGEYEGAIHGKNIDNSWLLYSGGFGNDIIYGGNGNKETIYINGGKDIVHANEGNKNISISGNQSDCDIYLGKEKTTKTNINLGAVEGNVTSNINEAGDLEVSWDCYADSDETTYTSKLRVDNWNKKTSQATIGISGNDRDNTLNAVDGVENIIDGGKGDDTLIGGDGVDTFNFIWNQEYGIDTVQGYSSNDILRFESASSFPVDFSKFKYYTNNNGKGLVINTNNFNNKDGYVIIDNYFEADSKIDKVTTYNWSSPDEEKSLATMYGDKSALGSFDVGTGSTIQGTDNQDVFIAKSGENTYIGGKGDDSLTSQGGKTTFVFNDGDGSDTLYQKGGEITLKFNDATIEELSSPTGYDRDASGYVSDLLIHYDGENTLRVKDYFYKNYVTKIIDSTENEYNMADYFKRVEYIDSIGADYMRQYSSKDEELRITAEIYRAEGKKGSDIIRGSDYKEELYTHKADNYSFTTFDKTEGVVDKIYAGGGNDTLVGNSLTNYLYGDEGNDTFIVFASEGLKTFVSDSSGTADSMNIYDETYDNLHFVFNIDNEGNMDSDGLRILNTENYNLWKTDISDSNIKGINITDWNCVENFEEKGDDSGCSHLTISTIETVKNDIASWLTSEGYSSVSDVLENEKIDGDITTLLGKFDITDKWQYESYN